MNNRSVKIFFLIEGILLLLTIFQLIQSWDLLLVILVGAILVNGTNKAKRSGVVYWVGWFLIGLSVLSTFTVWVMLAVALIYVIHYGGNIIGNLHLDNLFDMPWKKKNYFGVQTTEPVNHAGKRKKQKWLGKTNVGESAFEWDDINLSILMGDTIIDLGNTLLPDEQNVILIRKGFGQTRVIVPLGVGVSIQHSVLQGDVTFNKENYHLSNETMSLYSSNYSTASRKIKIISNTLWGDFEVIYL